MPTLSHISPLYVLTGGRQPEPNNRPRPRRHPCYLVLVPFIFLLDLWPEEARHGKKEGAQEGGKGLKKRAGGLLCLLHFLTRFEGNRKSVPSFTIKAEVSKHR